MFIFKSKNFVITLIILNINELQRFTTKLTGHYCYLSYNSNATIIIDETNNLTVTLNPATYISVTSDQAVARIMINGKEAGKGNVEKYRVAAGIVALSIKAPGFEPWTITMNLEQGAHESINAKLVSVFGKLSVSSTPKGAQVYLNEEKLGTTPYSASLKPGNYRLKVSMDAYIPYKEDITIFNNTIIYKNIILEHPRAYLDSVKQSKAKEKKIKKLISQVSLGLGAVAAGGLGLYFNSEASDAYDKYMAETSENSSVHRTNWEEYEKKAHGRNILYVAAGVLTACFAITIPF